MGETRERTTSAVPFDKERALLGTDGDRELLQELIELFLEDAPHQIARLREAIDTKDARAIGSAAHTLKGSAATVGALETARLALGLEQQAHGDDLAGAAATLQQLADHLEELETLLEDEKRAL